VIWALLYGDQVQNGERATKEDDESKKQTKTEQIEGKELEASP